MPVGIVNYFLPERRFGFLKYSSTSDSNRLDSEAYFKDSSLQAFVQAGDRVEFDLASLEDGRPEAVNIAPVDDRQTGVVVTIGRKQYGYISVDVRDGDNQQIFCAFDDVVPDAIGRRALPLGARVSFRIEIRKIGGETNGRERAIDVINEDSKLATIDSSTYREFGQVSFWNGDRGHIVRPNGDTLSFLAKNIITAGLDEIRIGSWLQYGINVSRYLWSDEKQNFYHRVFAKEIAVCLGSEEMGADSPPILPVEFVSPESFEAKFLEAEELPLSTPEPERIEPGHVYLKSERKLTIRELIDRKRAIKVSA